MTPRGDDEHELSPGDIERFSLRLRRRLAELDALSENSRESRDAVDLDQSRVGRLSRMDALQQQAMQQAAEARRESERQRIQVALSLIEQEAYGDCVRCGDEIALKRLHFDPSLITCVECA